MWNLFNRLLGLTRNLLRALIPNSPQLPQPQHKVTPPPAPKAKPKRISDHRPRLPIFSTRLEIRLPSLRKQKPQTPLPQTPAPMTLQLKDPPQQERLVAMASTQHPQNPSESPVMSDERNNQNK